MMSRVVGLALALALVPCLPFSAVGQQSKPVQIGLLLYSSASVFAPRLPLYRQALADLGWVEGRNLVIQERSAEQQNDRLPALAADLVRSGVSIILAENASATRAAMQATSTIPIVMMGVGDPVRYGFVKSLAQPGGNVTGASFLAGEVIAKTLELLKEAAPRITRVAFLVNPTNPGAAPILADLPATAQRLGVRVIEVDVVTAGDFERAFASIVGEKAEAILVGPEQLVFSQRHRITAFAEKQRLPSAFASVSFMDAGGLMAYSPVGTDIPPRVARFVDKILRGAKPADLPVDQPTRFDFVINAKTAKAIGLTLPPLLLQRADRVIE
jgi:putative tryptophan/tyrosine transport system substrate-binding protein